MLSLFRDEASNEETKTTGRENPRENARKFLSFCEIFVAFILSGKSFKGFKVSAVAWSAKRVFLRRSDLERERERDRERIRS